MLGTDAVDESVFVRNLNGFVAPGIETDLPFEVLMIGRVIDDCFSETYFSDGDYLIKGDKNFSRPPGATEKNTAFGNACMKMQYKNQYNRNQKNDQTHQEEKMP